jgi:hypothetical protein
VPGYHSFDRHGFFYHLGQRSHCWWVGRRRKESCPASASIKRPPKRNLRECEKWHGGECHQGALAVVRVLGKIHRHRGPYAKKAKNKCASIYNCFIFIDVFRESSKQVNTLRTLLTAGTRLKCKKKWKHSCCTFLHLCEKLPYSNYSIWVQRKT